MTSPNPPDDTSKSSGGARVWLIALAVIVVIAIAGGVFWYLSGDTPEEASIEGALEAVDDQDTSSTTAAAASESTQGATDSTQGATTTEAAAPAGEVSGTWAVDTSIGDFTFEEATGTFVGFRIKEELAGVGATEAVGRTPDVAGSLVIADTAITAVEVEANLDAIVTNDSRRDSRAKSALDTANFPTAIFSLTEPIDLGTSPAEGETVTASAVGDLTISGTTNPATFAIEAQLVEGLIVVVGSTEITFADYGVEVPSAPIVLSVEDTGVVELQLWFSQA